MKLLNCMIFFFFFFGQDSELNPLWDWDTPHHRNATPNTKPFPVTWARAPKQRVRSSHLTARGYSKQRDPGTQRQQFVAIYQGPGDEQFVKHTPAPLYCELHRSPPLTRLPGLPSSAWDSVPEPHLVTLPPQQREASIDQGAPDY